MRAFVSVVLSFSLILTGCAGLSGGNDVAAWGKIGKKFMVAADHPLASKVGAKVLAKGGNVVDAAVATSFALAVTRPFSTGLGGGGFMIVALKGREPVVIDYRETAPLAAIPRSYLDKDGNVIKDRTILGHWAVGVPGQLRGAAQALKSYGTRSLAEVLAPAIALAQDGFPVDASTHKAMKYLADKVKNAGDKKAVFAEAARIFLKKGEPYAVGERLRQPDLAKTLRLVAHGGEKVFYEGVVARRILDDMSAFAGPLTAEDLRSYRVRVRKPLLGKFRGYDVLGMPPPSSGGACLIEMLNVLGGYDPKTLKRPAYYHVLAEAMKHAFADRAAFLGDADYHPAVAKDVVEMISRERAEKIRAAIDPDKTFAPGRYGRRGLKDDHGTSHFSVIDAEGNAVAATETVNYYFGSLVVPPGTGVVLNDELDDFSVRTDVANVFGLLMSERNIIRPGQRPLSSMSPTILLREGRAVLVAGASGGPRIITATLQTILHILDFGKNPDEAVAASRIHHQWSPDRLLVEEGLSAQLREALAEKGHKIEVYPGGAGVAQVVYAKDGLIYGASDPRKGGRPAGK